MYDLLDEIINEANIGKIIIDGDIFEIAFNTIIYDDNREIFNNSKDNNYPSLIIKNKKILYKKMIEYVEFFINSGRKTINFSKDIGRNKIKLIMSYIFANATTEDFLNPINLLDRNIKFLKDDTFSYLEDSIYTEKLTIFFNSSLEIRNSLQSVAMETPNKIDISFVNSIDGIDVKYNLPSVFYGITEENNEKICYIYSLLKPKTKQAENLIQDKYEKKISREMYKINAGVLSYENDECKGSNRYIENISDVSPSAIISLVIFIGLLSKENINKIKVVPYLPVRFLARELSANNIDNSTKATQMSERNLSIQANITDKFIRTFRRVSYHLSKLKINSFPYEIDEYMEIILSNFDSNFNNQILEELYNITIASLNNKKIK